MKFLSALFCFSLFLFHSFGFAQSQETPSDRVDIFISPYPYGHGDLSDFFRGVIFSEKETRPCRPVPVDSVKLGKIPGLQRIFKGGEEISQNSLHTSVNISEPGGWMAFGLSILNHNEDYDLTVELMSLSAQSVGEDEVLNHGRTVAGGYCGLPFVYFVPAGKSLTYKPLSDNPLENLTVYIGGFPVSRRSNSLSVTVPGYQMDLTLLGRFVSESDIQPFLKRIRFHGQSVSFTTPQNESGN